MNDLAKYLERRLFDPRSFFEAYRRRNTGKETLDAAFMELISDLETSTRKKGQIFSQLVDWAAKFVESLEGRVCKLFIYPAIWDYVAMKFGSNVADVAFAFEHDMNSRPRGDRKPAPSALPRSLRAVKFNRGTYSGNCCDFSLALPLQFHVMGEIGYPDSAGKVRTKMRDDTDHCRKLLESNARPYAEVSQPFDAAFVLCVDKGTTDWDGSPFLVTDYVQVGNEKRPIVRRIIKHA